MKRDRLRAPSTDGALLAVPPLNTIHAQFRQTAERMAAWDYNFQGRRVKVLRTLVHRQVISAAYGFLARHGLDAPDPPSPGAGASDTLLFVTGHQPELFHPGVWVKNFATAALARRHGGLGLNLVVDNDLPKAASVRIPRRSGTTLRTTRVEFDRWTGEPPPYEDLVVQNEPLFASFGTRVSQALRGLVPDPLVDDFWPRTQRHAEAAGSLGLRLAIARRELEASWGVRNLEITLSQLCQTEGFLWFASHLLAHLPRFQEVHNTALNEYRALYGIRSKNHPVSALGTVDGWREAPFWVWRKSVPRRRPLLVRQERRAMLLRIAGEDEPLIELPLNPEREACCAVERLLELPGRSIRLRTRALTTTMFCRYLLGDLFLHGIGGAKYDELGDVVARRFFGIEPPGFLTLSMTAWLGIPPRETAASLTAIGGQLRDLTYNPDRHLSEPIPPELRKLINEKRDAIARPQTSRGERVARFHAIRHINEALQDAVSGPKESLQGLQNKALADASWNRVATGREYAFVLYPGEKIRDLMRTPQRELG